MVYLEFVLVINWPTTVSIDRGNVYIKLVITIKRETNIIKNKNFNNVLLYAIKQKKGKT